MEIAKNIEINLSEEHLKICQLVDLLSDIEQCALNLAKASRKAKVNFEDYKKSKYKELVT